MYFEYDVFYVNSENLVIVVKSLPGEDEWSAIELVEQLNRESGGLRYSYALVAKED